TTTAATAAAASAARTALATAATAARVRARASAPVRGARAPHRTTGTASASSRALSAAPRAGATRAGPAAGTELGDPHSSRTMDEAIVALADWAAGVAAKTSTKGTRRTWRTLARVARSGTASIKCSGSDVRTARFVFTLLPVLLTARLAA